MIGDASAWSRLALAALLLTVVSACGGAKVADPHASPQVLFDWFEYTGRDAAFEDDLPPGHYRNPVLAGFHPDPSVVRVGDRYYLVNSTFAYFPGIPVFESTDLVHWTQVGNVIDRPSQLDFDGLDVSEGIFAPTIEHRDGTFYVATTAVQAGGNFISTATDPAGPWSDPHWLPSVGGIDPSLFFDDDGRAYLLHNDAPGGEPRYDGHRAIWMQQIDLGRMQVVGPHRVVLDGGADPGSHPIWIEGPHLYKRDGWYYLSAAEGGTGPQHSQVVLRSREIWGPYAPYARNPILTQRDLPEDRDLPITNTGHADLVEGPDGTWWAVFLASRNYDRIHYNTGRETYLLPVEWRDGWPVILDAGKALPYTLPGPSWMQRGSTQSPLTGNVRWRDEFDSDTLDFEWLRVRIPKAEWADLHTHPGKLAITPLAEGLDTRGNPAFLARRQRHIVFDASTLLAIPDAGIAAGIAAFQNQGHWYFLGVRRTADGVEVFVEQRSGEAPATVLASHAIEAGDDIRLVVSGEGGHYAFGHAVGEGDVEWLLRDADGTMLSTERAGGFVGAMLGPYARDERVSPPRRPVPSP